MPRGPDGTGERELIAQQDLYLAWLARKYDEARALVRERERFVALLAWRCGR